MLYRDFITGIFDLYGNTISGIIGEISYWYPAKHKDWENCHLGNPDALTKGRNCPEAVTARLPLRESGNL